MAELMIDDIDWSRPWFRSIVAGFDKLQRSLGWRVALNRESAIRQLKTESGLPIRFIEQAMLPNDASYEQFIHESGQVPTRDNLHDFFNALVWLVFPRIKAQLNALQANEISKAGIESSRGAVRDAATLFDENAALLVIRNSIQGHTLHNALRLHNWRELFVERRIEFIRHSDIWLFGHALLEKMMKPYKAITAHAWVILANEEYFAKSDDQRREWLDTTIAAELERREADDFHTARFAPLPVLGVPEWWSGQDEFFYADDKIFRPRRLPIPTQL